MEDLILFGYRYVGSRYADLDPHDPCSIELSNARVLREIVYSEGADDPEPCEISRRVAESAAQYGPDGVGEWYDRACSAGVYYTYAEDLDDVRDAFAADPPLVVVVDGHRVYALAGSESPVMDAIEALSMYPILDEDDQSALHAELEREQWEDYGRSDLIHALRILAPDTAAWKDRIDAWAENDPEIDGLYWRCLESEGMYPEPDGGSGYFYHARDVALWILTVAHDETTATLSPPAPPHALYGYGESWSVLSDLLRDEGMGDALTYQREPSAALRAVWLAYVRQCDAMPRDRDGAALARWLSRDLDRARTTIRAAALQTAPEGV